MLVDNNGAFYLSVKDYCQEEAMKSEIKERIIELINLEKN